MCSRRNAKFRMSQTPWSKNWSSWNKLSCYSASLGERSIFPLVGGTFFQIGRLKLFHSMVPDNLSNDPWNSDYQWEINSFLFRSSCSCCKDLWKWLQSLDSEKEGVLQFGGSILNMPQWKGVPMSFSSHLRTFLPLRIILNDNSMFADWWYHSLVQFPTFSPYLGCVPISLPWG